MRTSSSPTAIMIQHLAFAQHSFHRIALADCVNRVVEVTKLYTASSLTPPAHSTDLRLVAYHLDLAVPLHGVAHRVDRGLLKVVHLVLEL